MAVGEGGFNPIGYHLGTVWPHDTRVRRARVAPLRLSRGGNARWRWASWRPPPTSTVGCQKRSPVMRAPTVDFPVEYPTACSPQAWATGAPLMLLRVMLGSGAGRARAALRSAAAGTHHASWSYAGSRGAGAESTCSRVTERGRMASVTPSTPEPRLSPNQPIAPANCSPRSNDAWMLRSWPASARHVVSTWLELGAGASWSRMDQCTSARATTQPTR